MVALVAEGHSNRDIANRLYVSRYTIEAHMKHVFAKLGVTSRTHLAAEYVRRQAGLSAGPSVST